MVIELRWIDQVHVKYLLVITGCVVAQHRYNGDVNFLRGNGNVDPCKIKTLNRLTHNLSWMIKSTKGTFKFGENPFTIHWNIIFLWPLYFFSDQHREQTPRRILMCNGSKDAESRKDVLLGVIKWKKWNLTHIYPKP